MKLYLPSKASFFATIVCMASFISFAQQQPKLFGKTIDASKINPANGLIRCASAEYESYQRSNTPGMETREQFETWLQQKNSLRMAQRSANNTNTIITIPVVVHVIHNGDAVGVNENIANAQVLSQITVLNQDFRKMVNTPGWNDNPVGADTEIQFALAVIDPWGNPTNGIDRVNLGVSAWNETAVENNLKPSTSWDPSKYFNIWVCNFGGDLEGVLGYAQFPTASSLPGLQFNGGSASTDGVIIGYQFFGSSSIYPQGNYGYPYDKGRTTTHEIGHALGLIHVDGDSASCTVNAQDSAKDYCPDTPAIYQLNYDCNFYDSCPAAAGNDMVENYMDYTPDYCMNIFTQNQKNRMLTVLQNSPRRATLTTSNVWLANPQVEALGTLSIYPNPAKDVLHINAPNELPESYSVYNSLGQIVAGSKVNSSNDLSINTATLSNGVYLITIIKGNESKTLKFIKN